MTHMPVTRELQPLLRPANRRARAAMEVSQQLESILTGPDLTAVVLFFAVGLLVTVAVILHFPDFGAMTEQFAQFP